MNRVTVSPLLRLWDRIPFAAFFTGTRHSFFRLQSSRGRIHPTDTERNPSQTQSQNGGGGEKVPFGLLAVDVFDKPGDQWKLICDMPLQSNTKNTGVDPVGLLRF